MFFDERNCRALKLLNETSEFLEASLEKLLALEQEALNEISARENRKVEEKFGMYSNSSGDVLNNRNSEFTPINSAGDLCNCGSKNCDHKCFNLFKKIKLASLVSDDSVNSVTGSVSKRKCEDRFFCENIENSCSVGVEKFKSDVKSNLSNSEENFQIKQECFDPAFENFTFKIGAGEALNVASNQVSGNGIVYEVKKITLSEEYFKILIKFKESFSYETVEELIKLVGIDDVFDLLLTKKKAELTFLNEISMKKALNLPPSALEILKAYSIEPIKKLKLM